MERNKIRGIYIYIYIHLDTCCGLSRIIVFKMRSAHNTYLLTIIDILLGDNNTMIAIIGGAVGGGVVLIIFITVIACVVKHSGQKPSNKYKRKPGKQMYSYSYM